MFDSLLGPRFSNKCKHSVKCIKCRMETIRKKKYAMVRYLKKDVADLVSTGHETNAFGRMDSLLFEINQASCYDMIEQYCCCILEHLSTMQKERECPKETLEAVATLIFAAARFPDLPELADLRRGFTERYGTNMESYTNREFVEKMQQKSFPQDKKLQLMKDIAQEFNVDWNVKSFEYKISNPSALTIDHPKIHFPSSNLNYKQSHMTDERREVTDRRNEANNGRKTVLETAEDTTYKASDEPKQQIGFEKLKTTIINKDQKIIQIAGDEHHSRSPVQQHQVQPEELRNTHTTPKNAKAHLHDSTEKIKKVAADESENVVPHHLGKRAPPYVKTKGNHNGNYMQDLICEGITRKRSEVHEGLGLVGTERQGATAVVSRNDKAINMFPSHTKFTEDFNGTSSYHDGFVHSTTEEVVMVMEHNGQRRQTNGSLNPESNRVSNLKPPYVKPKVKSLLETSHVKPTNYEMHSSGDNGDDHKNAAFSVRRKHLQQGTDANAGSTGEDAKFLGKISTKQANGVMKKNVMHMDVNDQQGFSWQSKQIEDDSMDRRMHRAYGDQTRHGRRSINATYDGGCDKEEEMMDKLSRHYSKNGVSNERAKARIGMREPIKDEQHSKFSPHAPTRTVSLTPTETPVGRHIRSVSLQPDLLSPNGDRAHPRLPNYDELASLIAALKKS